MTDSPALPTSLTRLLCVVILLVMLIALIYTGWMTISNYSRIHV